MSGCDGWSLEWDHDDDGDVVRTTHWAVHEDGRRVEIDWSPYRGIGRDDLRRLVALGFPTRFDVGSIGPLTSADLDRLELESESERREP